MNEYLILPGGSFTLTRSGPPRKKLEKVVGADGIVKTVEVVKRGKLQAFYKKAGDVIQAEEEEVKTFLDIDTNKPNMRRLKLLRKNIDGGKPERVVDTTIEVKKDIQVIPRGNIAGKQMFDVTVDGEIQTKEPASITKARKIVREIKEKLATESEAG